MEYHHSKKPTTEFILMGTDRSFIKPFKRSLLAALCVWLGWSFIGAVVWPREGGQRSSGCAVVAIDDFRALIKSRGFALCPSSASPFRVVQPSETYQGSYRGSRPIFVTISMETNNVSWVPVDVSWEFRELTWGKRDASAKAGEFAETVVHWLNERWMMSIGEKARR